MSSTDVVLHEMPELCYHVGTQGWEADLERGKQVFVDGAKIDYDVQLDQQQVPISYCDVSSVEEGVEYYARRHPEFPDWLLEVCAEYEWGNWRSSYNPHAKPQPPPPPPHMVKRDESRTLRFD